MARSSARARAEALASSHAMVVGSSDVLDPLADLQPRRPDSPRPASRGASSVRAAADGRDERQLARRTAARSCDRSGRAAQVDQALPEPPPDDRLGHVVTSRLDAPAHPGHRQVAVRAARDRRYRHRTRPRPAASASRWADRPASVLSKAKSSRALQSQPSRRRMRRSMILAGHDMPPIRRLKRREALGESRRALTKASIPTASCRQIFGAADVFARARCGRPARSPTACGVSVRPHLGTASSIASSKRFSSLPFG